MTEDRMPRLLPAEKDIGKFLVLPFKL